jgi:hypothetical protein
MVFFLEIIKGTPWWVFLILCYLLIVGIKARYLGAVSLKIIKKLFPLPFAFITWSAYALSMNYGANILTLGLWAGSLSIGSYLGWIFGKSIPIKLIDNKLHMQGSWLPLVLSLLIFSAKYFVGVITDINPASKQSFYVLGTDLIFSGSIAGIFLGRLLALWKRCKSLEKTVVEA